MRLFTLRDFHNRGYQLAVNSHTDTTGCNDSSEWCVLLQEKNRIASGVCVTIHSCTCLVLPVQLVFDALFCAGNL